MRDVNRRLPARCWSLFLVHAVLIWMLALIPAAVASEHEALAEVRVGAEQRAALIVEFDQALPRIDAGVVGIDTAPLAAWMDASPLQRLLVELERSAEGGDAQSLWRAAVEHEQAGIARIEGAMDRATTAQGAVERVADAVRRLQALRPAPTTAQLSGLTLGGLEERVQQSQQRMSQLAFELEQKRTLLDRLETQARSQTETIERLRREGSSEFGRPPVEISQDLALTEAHAAWERSRDRRVDARLLAAQLDASTLPVRIDVLRLEVPALHFEAAWQEREHGRLLAHLGERADEELRNLRGEVLRVLEFDPDAAATLVPPPEELLQRIEISATWQARMRSLQQRRADDSALAEDLADALTALRQRLELGGLTDALGRFLQQENRRVRRLSELRPALRDLQRESGQARLRELSLRQELRDVGLVPAATLEEDLTGVWRRLQRDVLQAQVQTNAQLIEHIEQAVVYLALAVREADALERLIQESMLWWPSHLPVGLEWAMGWPALMPALIDPRGWAELRHALIESMVGSPILTLGMVLLLGALMMGARRAPERISALAVRTRHRFTDQMSLTWKALGWTLLRIAPIPVLMIALGLRMRALPDAAYAVEVFSGTLLLTAAVWLVVRGLLRLGGEAGVGRAHLRWPVDSLVRVRRELLWFFPLSLVFMLCIGLSFGHGNELIADLAGRAMLAAFSVLVVVFGWRLSPWIAEVDRDPDRSHRRRRWLRGTLLGVGLLMIVLTLAGYLYTVLILLSRLLISAMVLLTAWLIRRLALRALMLSENRLVLRRMREQRALAASSGGAGVGEGAAVDVPEPHLSVENVNLQTRKLLDMTMVGSLVLALLWVWAQVLPALIWLDGFTLWTRTIVVGDSELISRVSLQDGLLAVFLGVLLTLAARNLPGLVEIVLARSTHMDAAGRYTVTTLLRYVLAVVAVISVFSLLGLRWSELQWMVAALTLGLGFGLQEVVANFVSGIIMLFERPVRVGDTITIGEFSGTVSRIRTRATTIVDWDNREILIPNKMFITERLINWTLTDTMTRVVIPVGVSYDADINEVMTTLDDIARGCPQVLDDPSPQVLFLSLGNSTLNFELRVYVNLLRERNETISMILQRVIAQFRQRGIEIAYPQMDIHVRDMVAPTVPRVEEPEAVPKG
jgi:potassium-dependent mechanosensitive channel